MTCSVRFYDDGFLVPSAKHMVEQVGRGHDPGGTHRLALERLWFGEAAVLTDSFLLCLSSDCPILHALEDLPSWRLF